MRARVKDLEVHVDLVNSVVDVGQLAALAPKLGWTVFVEPDWDGEFSDADRPSGVVVKYERADPSGPSWVIDEIVHLAMVYGYAYGKTGKEVVTAIQAELVERGYPSDRTLQDTFGIGEEPRRNPDGDEDS